MPFLWLRFVFSWDRPCQSSCLCWITQDKPSRFLSSVSTLWTTWGCDLSGSSWSQICWTFGYCLKWGNFILPLLIVMVTLTYSGFQQLIKCIVHLKTPKRAQCLFFLHHNKGQQLQGQNSTLCVRVCWKSSGMHVFVWVGWWVCVFTRVLQIVCPLSHRRVCMCISCVNVLLIFCALP